MSAPIAKEETLETVSAPPTNDLHLSHEEAIHLTKNRIVAVDIARLLAAFIVMFLHLMPSSQINQFYLTHNASAYATICKTTLDILYHIFPTPSNLFFVLAGYFACRNITWQKAFKNAWWSFVPYCIWCAIAIGGVKLLHIPYEQSESSTWLNLFGINRFFVENWILNSGGRSLPLNVPLWFMRDLIFLFLLSPLLYKGAKYLFPTLVLLSLIPSISNLFNHNSAVTCSLYSISFFTGGCFLRQFSKAHQAKALQFCSIWIILGYFAIRYLTCKGYITFAPIVYLNMVGEHLTRPIPALVSIWILYQISRWVELHVPFAKEFALKFAPVTFLTFASHWMIFHIGKNYIPILLLPFISFILMALFFFAMKRWCRPLLHPVAHYVLRPDDLKPKQSK